MKKENSVHGVKEKKVKRNPFVFIGSVLLLIALTIAFVFTPGFGTSAGNNQEIVFGSYDGEEIVWDDDFSTATENYMQQIAMFGQQISEFEAMEGIFRDYVRTYAFIDEVEDSGYLIPKSKLDREMIPYYMDENGNYSEMRFQQTDKATRIAIKDETEKRIMHGIYEADLLNTRELGKEKDFIDAMNNIQRSFNVVSFATSNYPLEEMEKFGNENAELFELFNMKIITLHDKESAETVRARISSEEITFVDAISEFSINQYSSDDGILNNKYQYELKNILANETDFDTIKGLEVGTMSEVLETKTGYSIFFVDAASVPAQFPNENLEAIVYNYLDVFEKGRIEEYFINNAKDFVASALSNGYENAIEEYDATSSVVEYFPLNYGNVPVLDTVPTDTSAQLAEAQSNEQFFEKAFALEDGEYTEPMLLGDDVVVFVLNDEITVTREEEKSASFANNIKMFNSTDIFASIMSSDKFENNFYTAVIENFM